MTRIILAFSTGLKRTVLQPRLILFFYLANLAAGILVTIPLKNALKATAGFSLLADRLVAGIDWNLVAELFQANRGLGSTMAALAIVLGGIYLVAGLFFSAGAYEELRDQADSAGFWGGAARHFWVFFRILLWLIPVLIPIGLLVAALGWFRRLIVGEDPLQNIAFWSRLAVIGAAFLGLLIVSLVLDYARAYAVVRRDRRAGNAVRRAIGLIWKHPGVTGGFLVLLLAAGVLAAVLFEWAGSSTGFFSSGPAGALFLLGQAFILSRMILRLVRYAGALKILDIFDPQQSSDYEIKEDLLPVIEPAGENE